MTVVTRQSMVDDDGTFTFGTGVNKAFVDQLYDQIDDQVHSGTNPTVKPKQTTDEVVAARGSMGSLDARLDVSLEENGALKTQASLVSVTTAGTIVNGNLAPNSDFLLWPNGDASAPAFWSVGGAGAAIARTGTGLGDTTRSKYGDFAAKLTYGSATAQLLQTILSAAAFARADGLKSRKVSLGAWVKCSTAGIARLVLFDGVTSTASSFHTGGGTFEWLTVTHTMSGSATLLQVYCQVEASGSAYFGSVFPVISNVAPADFLPCPMVEKEVHWVSAGVQTAAANKQIWMPSRPGIITDVQLRLETAPTGAAFIVDVNTWDGAAMTTAFTTKPQIAIGAQNGGQAPDGTYARRCFAATFGTTIPNGGILTYDVDQIGSGTAGSDLKVLVRFREYVRPFEGFAAYDDI